MVGWYNFQFRQSPHFHAEITNAIARIMKTIVSPPVDLHVSVSWELFVILHLTRRFCKTAANRVEFVWEDVGLKTKIF